MTLREQFEKDKAEYIEYLNKREIYLTPRKVKYLEAYVQWLEAKVPQL